MFDEFTGRPRRSSGIAHIFSGLVGAIVGALVFSLFYPAIAPTSERVATQDEAPKNNNASMPGGNESAPAVVNGNGFIYIAQKVGPAVVGISNRSSKMFDTTHPEVEQSSGSGVIFDERGYIITNNHVVENATTLVVNMPNGKDVSAKLIGRDPRTDLAVVKIDPAEAGAFTVATLGDSDKLQVGEDVVAIGNPLGQEFAGTVTRGIVSALNRELVVQDQRFKLIQTDAAINPGNSGGALINTKGEVIGINSIKIMSTRVEGLNFAIPMNDARPIAESLIKNGKVIRPWIGIKGASNNAEIAKEFKLAVATGVLADVIVEKGPAANAGMKSKDVIVAIGNTPVKVFDDLLKTINSGQVGQVLDVKVNRYGEELVLKVTLGEMPAEVN